MPAGPCHVPLAVPSNIILAVVHLSLRTTCTEQSDILPYAHWLDWTQEVLGGLQGHLGSGQAGEISTALAVLLSLTGQHAGQLLQHAHFVTALLDCLDTFSQAQLHQV